MEKKLEIKNLNLEIDNEILLKNIDFNVNENEIVGIVGESGSGKTLTSKFILGILPEKSNISYDINYNNMSMGAIFQNSFVLFNPTIKIGTQLKHLYKSHYKNTKGFDEMMTILFNKFGLDKNRYMNKYSHETSGGERQRISIIGALIGNPDILIADEVTTALDSDSKNELIGFFKKLKGEKKSIVFITHEINLMRDFVDRIYVMYNGTIIEHNTTYEIFNNPQHEYTKKLIELSNKYRG